MNNLNQPAERLTRSFNNMSQGRASVQAAGGAYEQYKGSSAPVINNYNTLQMPVTANRTVVEKAQDTVKTWVETGISNYQGATGGPVPATSSMYQPQGGYLAPKIDIPSTPYTQFSSTSAPQPIQESPTIYRNRPGGNRTEYDGPKMSTTGYDSGGKLQRSEGQLSNNHSNVGTSSYDSEGKLKR
jgi:hypothetical protein